VVREVREEVGLEVRAGAEVFRCRTEDGRFLIVWFEAELVAPAEDPALALLPAEVAEARWLTPGEALLLAPMFPRTREFFEARAAAGDATRARSTPI
jgi:8-oxo-dGTP diphosphatase